MQHPVPHVAAATLLAAFTHLPAQRVIGSVAGPNASDALGYAMAVLGDVDADGIPDFAVGMPGEDYGTGVPDRGMVRVISGRDRRTLHFIPGPRAGARLGTAVAALGDIDRDGIPDFAAGAPEDQGATGFVTVRSGRTGAELASLAGVSGSGFGTTLAVIGDWNGDHQSDLVVGAPRHRGGSAGAFLSVFSLPYGLLLDRFSLIDENGFSAFGAAMASVGDIDRDGRNDVAVGAPGYSVSLGNRGAVFVVGSNGLGTRRSIASWTGANAGDLFGSSVAAAGDVDGDGVRDVLVGAPTMSGVGHAYVMKATQGQPLLTFTGDAVGDNFGLACSMVGDMNGDGRADLAVGAPDHDGGRGRVRVFDGTTPAVLFEVTGNPGDRCGYGVTSLGDIDGDRRADALISRPWADAPTADGGAVDLVIYAPAGAATSFGTACTGAAGTPALRAVGALAIGTPVRLEARNLVPGVSGVLFVGASRTTWQGVPLPFALTLLGFPGCQLLASGDVLVPARAGTFPNLGIAEVTIPIPNAFASVEERVYFQYMSSDPRPGGLTFSNGVELRIGR